MRGTEPIRGAKGQPKDHSRTDPNADEDHDFTSLIGGRWVAVNPALKAKDLTNNEAVHMALALQTILLKV